MKTQLTDAERTERRETHEQERIFVENELARAAPCIQKLKKRTGQRAAHPGLLIAYARHLLVKQENVDLKARLERAETTIANLTRDDLHSASG